MNGAGNGGEGVTATVPPSAPPPGRRPPAMTRDEKAILQATVEAEAAERAIRRRKPKRRSPEWVHGPLYVAIRSTLSALCIGSIEQNLRLARLAGRRFALTSINRRRFERALVNLRVAFPEWSEDRRRQCAVEGYEHLFMLAVETAYAPRLITPDGAPPHVQLGNLANGMECLLGQGPCLLITGHCGNWELLGYKLALLGLPMHALYRPLDLKPLDRWARETRGRQGLVLVDKFGAARELPRLLERSAPVGFVADQNGGDRGLFVPFFGRLASSYKTIGLLAMRHGAPLVCGHARRLEAGDPGVCPTAQRGAFRYVLDIVDVIRPDDWVDQPDPLFYITARYRRAIEAMVRRAPDQYLWMHRYWKSRPRHERLGREIPASLVTKIEQLPWMTQEDVRRVVEWSRRDAAALAAEQAE